jgi:NAD+ kinase
MTNFAVFINPSFSDLHSIFSLLERLKKEHRIEFFGVDEQRDILPEYIHCRDLSQIGMLRIDCVLVFGGDGTILRAKEIALATSAPILGINLGYLGFLSETTLNELQASLQTLFNGRYKLLSRMLIQSRLIRDGNTVFQGLALNDAVLFKAETPRMIQVRISCNGRFVFNTRCDGVIAATPTGSTAYSLSAGGPLLSPETEALVINPLNPHILSIRPMVFPARDHIRMQAHGMHEPGCLQIDGVNSVRIEEGDEVLVTAAKRRVDFIRLSNRTFYRILRNKLHLGK